MYIYAYNHEVKVNTDMFRSKCYTAADLNSVYVWLSPNIRSPLYKAVPPTPSCVGVVCRDGGKG